jgi:hypothetical protein
MSLPERDERGDMETERDKLGLLIGQLMSNMPLLILIYQYLNKNTRIVRN